MQNHLDPLPEGQTAEHQARGEGDEQVCSGQDPSQASGSPDFRINCKVKCL